ncbi:MAG TPA: carotenoid oxygenase family protein [Acidimicrobiales bacterium]|nr:carotenoid oxygenase family protein [Acidimicrobiales bacterium]
MAAVTNPYLEGDFAPVREERTDTELQVEGKLPEYLDGRYLRIGPNPVRPRPAVYHWFMGAGMVHGLRIRDGRAEWYRNRYVRSGPVRRALGEPKQPGKVKAHAGFDMSPNTNVIGYRGHTLALVEAGPRPYELTFELETIGPCDFDGTLSGGYSAHPLVDPATGELHAVSYYFGSANLVHYSVTGTDGRVRHTAAIEVGGSPMMHAFSLTERFVVLYDLPVTFDARKAAAFSPRPFAKPTELLFDRVVGRRRVPDWFVAMGIRRLDEGSIPYSWNSDYPARIGVMPRQRSGSEVRWFDVEPCYVYHPLNAYEDGDRIVLDVVRHQKMFATEHRGPNEGAPTLDRWTLDLTAGKLLEERLDDRGQEFPRMDERLVGRRHRYGYTVGGFGAGAPGDRPTGAPVADCVIKHDLAGGTSALRRLGAGKEADEFLFVPAQSDAEEDEGVLMGFVYDRTGDRSDWLVLDAGTLEPMASVHLPVRVPHGFHGNWVPV